jgi:hypothetical protein
MAVLKSITGEHPAKIEPETWKQLFDETLATRQWLVKNSYESRQKDYTNPFRLMMYDSKEEMEQVIGKLKDNEFIQQESKELGTFASIVAKYKKMFTLK